MNTVEEIERALEQLPPEDFAKLTAWIDQRRAVAEGDQVCASAPSDATWFEVYMACPHVFEIAPRQKQFYGPKS